MQIQRMDNNVIDLANPNESSVRDMWEMSICF